MKTGTHMTVEEIYGDIIQLPHYEPKNHPRMELYKRAAQFAPFAALTGYDEKVEEAARYVDRRIDLSQEDMDRINTRLKKLKDQLAEKPEIQITFFQKDEKKEGGTYLTIKERVRKMDELRRQLVLADGRKIRFQDIWDIKSSREMGENT